MKIRIHKYVVADDKKHILPWQEQKCAFVFYCCLLKTIVKTTIKANAIIAVITNAIKNMYIIAVK